jgi:hypothetical protein
MHVAVADAPSQWRLGKVLDRNRKKLTDTLNRTPPRSQGAKEAKEGSANSRADTPVCQRKFDNYEGYSPLKGGVGCIASAIFTAKSRVILWSG